MAGINVNQRGVNPSLLKQKNVAQAQAQEINTEVGASQEVKLKEMVQKLCTGGYGSFNEFKEDLVKNGIEVNNLQIVQLDARESSILTFEFNGKNYKFHVPTEYATDEPTSSANGNRGVQGTGAINAPNAPNAPTDIDPDIDLELSKIEEKKEIILEGFEDLANLNLPQLLNLSNICTDALSDIDWLLRDDELTQDQLSRLNSLKDFFSIKRMLINNKILGDYYENLTDDNKDKYAEEIATDINTLAENVKKYGFEYLPADMNNIDEMIKKIQNGNLEISDEDYNEIQSAYNELKKYELNHYQEKPNELSNEQIADFLEEYGNWMDNMDSIINGEMANAGDYAGNIEDLQHQLEMLGMYNSFFNGIAEHMTPNQTQQLESIENNHANLQNQLADIYSNAVNEMLSDGQLSMEEAQTAQNLAESIYNIFPNAELTNIVNFVVNGWQESYTPMFTIAARLLLSDEGEEAYANLLKVNTSTYTGKKEAVRLLEQIIAEIKDNSEDDDGTGGGNDGFFKGNIDGIEYFLKVLELRKDFLEQQIEAMERRMVRRVDSSIGIAQNTQTFR